MGSNFSNANDFVQIHDDNHFYQQNVQSSDQSLFRQSSSTTAIQNALKDNDSELRIKAGKVLKSNAIKVLQQTIMEKINDNEEDESQSKDLQDKIDKIRIEDVYIKGVNQI